MVRKQFLCLLFGIYSVSVFAADALPGNKHYVVDDSSDVVQFLSWILIPEPAPKPLVKYKREKHFGRWIDFPYDDTCLTTRGIVLDRDTLVPMKTYVDNPCYADKGFWYDPYTNANFSFAKQVEIDHVVPLKNAYLSGAWAWSWRRRCSYFNFLGHAKHLIPIESKTNSSKLDYGPERWMPPHKKFHCEYLENWLRVKTIWKLRLSEKEAAGIDAIVQEYKCDLSSFSISQKELIEQRQSIIKIANDCPPEPKK